MKQYAYGIRSCALDGTSLNGHNPDVIWPKKGKMKDPYYQPTQMCGNGLHFNPWGSGDANLLANRIANVRWSVVRYDPTKAIDLQRKGKVEECTVVFSADGPEGLTAAVAFLVSKGARQHGAVCYDTWITGDNQSAQVGDCGIAKAGYKGTATAGYKGTATAGDYSTATAGNGGTATAGRYGTATAGYKGTATAGNGGTLQIKYWDGARYRIKTGYVGEDGILPNVKYKLDDNHNFVAASP